MKMKELCRLWYENWLEVFLASASLYLLLHFVYFGLAIILYGPNFRF